MRNTLFENIVDNQKGIQTIVIEVKVKSFAPRQIQRRSFAALAITLSRKIF